MISSERYCKFLDGAIKPFDEVKKGDKFYIYNPTGEKLTCLDTGRSLFLAQSDYDIENLGFKGEWIEGGEL